MNIPKDSDISTQLLKHLEAVDYNGFDPSTIRFSRRMLNLMELINYFPRNYYLKAIVSRIAAYGGHRLNFIIKPEKITLPKCLALSAIAHTNLSRALNLSEHALKAETLLQRLLTSSLPAKKVWSHGYPYKIKDVDVYVNTPNLVTTYFVAEAFWHYSKIINSNYESIYNQIVNDALEIFPSKPFDKYACFMYTPESCYFVHNANLMMVEMIAKRSAVLKKHPPSIAEKALLFTLTHFEKTGAFPYAGGIDSNYTEDNYHTGYVLRSLYEIKQTEIFQKYKSRIDACISNGIQRYLKLFLKNNYIVRDSKLTINSHSLAEAILVKTKLKTYMDATQRSQIDECVQNTQNYLWNDRKRIFINAAYSIMSKKLYIKDCTDMPRWSQAWMARALSEE